MTGSSFTRLEDVVLAEDFPEVDLALRRGQHIDRDSGPLYSFLVDAQDHLETFYRRYGCELIQSADGFFYLLPTGDRLGRRHLSPGEMLVGQALTLLYLDPATVQQGGQVSRDQLLGYLAGLVGTESLLRLFNPKRRRFDERVAEEAVRAKVGEALRRLAGLGFIDLASDGQMRLRPALMRFAEPVRGSATPELALERLVAKGELVLAPLEGVDDDDETPEREPDEEAPDEVDLDPAIYDTDFEPLDEATLGPVREPSAEGGFAAEGARVDTFGQNRDDEREPDTFDDDPDQAFDEERGRDGEGDDDPDDTFDEDHDGEGDDDDDDDDDDDEPGSER